MINNLNFYKALSFGTPYTTCSSLPTATISLNTNWINYNKSHAEGHRARSPTTSTSIRLAVTIKFYLRKLEDL